MGDYIVVIQEIVSECLDNKSIGITESLLANGVDSMNMLFIRSLTETWSSPAIISENTLRASV